MHLRAALLNQSQMKCVSVCMSATWGGGGGTRLIDSAVNKLQRSPNAPVHADIEDDDGVGEKEGITRSGQRRKCHCSV